jgi:transglutaminase-like putative cysteine protease
VETPRLPGSPPLRARAVETGRVALVLGLVVFVAVVSLTPSVADAIRRKDVAGNTPTGDARDAAASSMQSSDHLDMTTRPRLSNRVVFTVAADHPDFWRGETWDTWNGSTWTRAASQSMPLARQGRHVSVPPAVGDVGAGGETMHETFRVEAPYSDVVFAAPSGVDVETDRFVLGRDDGTMWLPGGSEFGQGSVYTVTSRRADATEATLRASSSHPVPDDIAMRYAQMPVSTARVRALALQITAGAPTAYDKVLAIEQWLAANTRYSLNAPLSPPGADVVDHFVFVSRLGWCEQVASTLTVMLRVAGVPARVATGFATGKQDPLSGRYVVRERDAHAWTEVYFPGVGWQGFDPTASVPLAGEASSPRSWLQQTRHALPFLAALALLVAGFALAWPAWRRRHARTPRRAPSWAATSLRRLERLGRRFDVDPEPGQTVSEYGTAVAVRLGEPELAQLADVIDTDAFSARGATAGDRAQAEQVLAAVEARVRARKSRRGRGRVVRSIDRPMSGARP